MPAKFKDAYEEAHFMRAELKKLMSIDPVMQNIRNHFLSYGIDRSRIDIMVTQAFQDEEKRQKLLAQGKKFYMMSLLFLGLFSIGVVAWFYVWGDWITYFAGANLVAFLFLIQKGNSFRSEAEIYVIE